MRSTFRAAAFLAFFLASCGVKGSDWRGLHFTEGARPVSDTAVSCWVLMPQANAQQSLLFLVLLKGAPGWYNAQTTHDSNSSDSGFQWKWRVGDVAYTILYEAERGQVSLFGRDVLLSAANIIVVDHADTSRPAVRGLAHVDMTLAPDADVVEAAAARSAKLKAWIATKHQPAAMLAPASGGGLGVSPRISADSAALPR